MLSQDTSDAEWGLFSFKEFLKISEISSITTKHKNVKVGAVESITDNKTMTVILTKVTSYIANIIQENKVIKKKNSIFKERLIKLEYHLCYNNLLFDGFLEFRNETDNNCYELVRQALSNLYIDDDDIKK